MLGILEYILHKRRISSLSVIVVVALTFAMLLYALSYGILLPLLEYCGMNKPTYFAYEGVELLRNKSDLIWNATEDMYRYFGGKEKPATRYGFSTPRKLIEKDAYGRKCTFIYFNGKKHGLQSGWWPNGNLGFLSNYTNDQPNGESKSWYCNGNLHAVGHFSNGLLIGKFVKYYRDGKIKFVCDYDSNGHVTEQVDYNKSGGVIAKGRFINNKFMDGSFLILDKYIVTYNDGKFVNVADLNGNIINPPNASMEISEILSAQEDSSVYPYPWKSQVTE